MKCTILHESRGRMRVHVHAVRMTLHRADVLEAYLNHQDSIHHATVYERTGDVVLTYTGSRKEAIALLAGYKFDNAELDVLVTSNDSRKINREYQDKMFTLVAGHYARKLFLPAPIAAAYTIWRSIAFVWKGIRCLLQRKLEVEVLDALSISAVLTESRVTSAASAAAASASSGSDAVLTVPALLPQEEDGKLPDATAPDAVNVRVCFDDDNATGFSYDADSGLYRMLHADGTPQLDANNGQQAGFDNLLVLFSASELRDDGKTYDYDLSMGGGVWLNGGHLWTITWTQGRDNTLLLYDADGRTMNIEAGTSYIALVTSLTGQELTVTNSSGEEILG